MIVRARTAQEVKMSEQVKRYSLSEFAEQHTHPVGPGTYVEATDYDALHAETEALRTENGRKQKAIDGMNAEHWKLVQAHAAQAKELEAARGLLRDIFCTCNLREMPSEHAIQDISNQIEALLTATPAPEVRHALSAENQRVVPPEPIIAPQHPLAALAEQGERQEAVARVGMVPGTDFKSLDFFKTDLQDLPAGTKLYTTPQPGPDVRGLTAFALELIDGALEGGSFDGGEIQDAGVRHGLLVVEQREESCGEHCDCAQYGFPAECYRLTPAIAAHRQAQRQA